MYLYSGTPRSGKSLHAAYVIWDWIKRDKRPVIANFPINLEVMDSRRKKVDRNLFIYKDNHELTPEWLIDYAIEHHKPGREGEYLLVIDECALLFNTRMWDVRGRQEWVYFFQQHGKYGYDVILITQNDKYIDKQIRVLIELEIKHRALRNYKMFGRFLSFMTGGLFMAIEYWYCARVRNSSQAFTINKRKASIYNTHQLLPSPFSSKKTGSAVLPRNGTRSS